jgi:type I restriction enzyme M protein
MRETIDTHGARWGGRLYGLYGSRMAQDFEVELDDAGKIIDFLSGNPLEATPEEFVRQRYMRTLHFEYGYPKNQMAREVPVYYGSKLLTDAEGRPVRADVAIYKSKVACDKRDQGQIYFVVECKKEKETAGYAQLVSYIYNTSAEAGVWFNGDTVAYFRRETAPSNALIAWPGVPRYKQTWDAVGRRRKDQLVRPKDVKGLLRLCHNKLHGRGAEGDEEDLTMDMVRLVLAKAQDEEQPDPLPEFYCSPEEYSTKEGQAAVASRIQTLFRKAAENNPDVFAEHERIQVGDRAICDVVVELQQYQLLADLSDSADWDLMGHAYEQYTATHLKRQRGQFFTNRLVVDFMVGLLKPNYEDRVLDPAGGSGGFLTSTLRNVRAEILSGSGTQASKAKRLETFRNRLFLVEISRRLVKVAKTAMILNGDGHAGMTQGDSLGDYNDFEPIIREKCAQGTPTLVLTNPPFAGVGEGRVRDVAVLGSFATGHRWAEDDNGIYRQTEQLLADGAPPELLFFERVLDWTAPGGRFGIVLRKSFLDTHIYRSARELLFSKCCVLAVVNCHKNTFQPHTGVRTCLVFAEKLSVGQTPDEDYEIFMALSRRIGQDSEGVPIYKRDSSGAITDEIDQDLSQILDDYHAVAEGSFVASESRFTAKRSDLDAQLRFNPQAFLPHLNETIRRLEAVDARDGWSVSALGQLHPDISIFKGPRLKSESIIVEGPEAGNSSIEPYFTPSAVLQDKADSVKWLNVGHATKRQLKTIDGIRVHKGDIVVTRSGSIGRVAMITSRMHRAIVSDDLIRIRVGEKWLRWYLYAFLQSQVAQDQIMRNEYGAVQQHPEPQHIREILVPVPDDPAQIAEVVRGAKRQIKHKERTERAGLENLMQTSALLASLMDQEDEDAETAEDDA